MVVLILFLSLSTLIEKYLQECWPIVKGALKEHGVACELNLVGYLLLFFFYPSFSCSGFMILNCFQKAGVVTHINQVSAMGQFGGGLMIHIC